MAEEQEVKNKRVNRESEARGQKWTKPFKVQKPLNNYKLTIIIGGIG